jgi:hypothetical protein
MCVHYRQLQRQAVLLRVIIEEELFSYSKEQPEECFNPDALAEKLKDPRLTACDLKYMFLQDPGGKSQPTPGS